jgi:hypothetical protein
MLVEKLDAKISYYAEEQHDYAREELQYREDTFFKKSNHLKYSTVGYAVGYGEKEHY